MVNEYFKKQYGKGPLARAGKLLSLWLVLLVPQTLMAAVVTATLDRNQIVQGETVTLVLQTEDPSQSLETDLSPLEADFLVIDRRSETQMSIVNGSRSAKVRMSLVLEPRRSGRLIIPSLEMSVTAALNPFHFGSTRRLSRCLVRCRRCLLKSPFCPMMFRLSFMPNWG